MNKFFYSLLLGLLVIFGTPALSGASPPVRTQRAVDRLVKDTVLRHAGISLQLVNVATGKSLASYQPNQSLAPASTLKLLTTATALELLGNDFRFETQLEYDGALLPTGIISGNLYIKGEGDPALASKYFPEDSNVLETWTQKIRQYNIKKINGAVIGDNSYFDPDLPRTWIWEDIANYYGAVAHGLSYRDNTFTLFFESDTAGTLTQIVDVSPKIDNLEFRNHVLSSVRNRDEAYLFGGPNSSVRYIRGTIPQNRESFGVKGSLPNPSLQLAGEFTNYLQTAGISVSLEPKQVDTAAPENSRKALFTHYSPPLEEIVFYTNQKSINLFAEHLLKQAGKHALQEGSTAKGIKALKSFWQEKGVDTLGAFLFDGSGLSRFNAISANFLTQVLIYMHKSPNFKIFYNSLPNAGNSGTLKSFGKNTPLENNLRAKTGSLTKVRGYSGYLRTKKGKLLAFTLLVNNYSCSSKVLAEKIREFFMEIFNAA